jgi:hypothetical protein
MTTKSAKHEQYERAASLAARLIASPSPTNDRVRVNKIVNATVELLRLADRLHRYAEAACNYQLTPAQEKRVEHLEARVQAICCDELGIGVKFNGDPRGYAVKLLLPSGDYNTWGGKEDGWGI